MKTILWQALMWAPVGLGVCVIAVALGRAWQWRTYERRCVGRDVEWRDAWRPWRVLRRLRCGYVLDRLTPASGGRVVCPECGCVSSPISRARQFLSAGRPVAVGLVLSVLALVPLLAPWARSGKWAAQMPHDVLLAVRECGGRFTPLCVRSEVTHRAGQKDMSARQKRWIARLLVTDLRDDDIYGNAMMAYVGLALLPLDIVEPVLELALAGDYQQRQIAAALLRSHELYVPSDACLRVTVEGLASDSLPSDGSTYMWVFNARDGLPFLVRNVDAASAHLKAALVSPVDGQQEFLAAAAFGLAGRREFADLAAPVLVLRLRSNWIEDDAKLASGALVGLGIDAAPYLQESLESDDAQERRLAALICRRVYEPGASVAEVAQGDPARITVRGADVTTVPVEVLMGR